MDVTQFLNWLASAGGSAIALSFIAERIPAFQKLTSAQKSYTQLAGSLFIALAAYLLLAYLPPALIEQIKPYFLLLAGVVATWLANQVAHKADPGA